MLRLWKLRLCRREYIWPVLSLWIVFVEVTCLQNALLLYFLGVIFWLCERCVGPMRSHRFLLRRKANIGFSVNEDAILLLVCRPVWCQCLLITSLTFERLLVNVVQKRTRLSSFFSFRVSSSFPSMDLALVSCLWMSFSG